MGYYIQQTEDRFFIPKEFHGLALAAIKDFMTKKYSDSDGEYIGWFSWVNTQEVVSAKTLHDALYAWRWEAYPSDGESDIESIHFLGEKSGQDEELFRVLAPYVKEGSYIAMRGEEGDLWRWYFDGQTCREQEGRVVWDD